MDTPVDAHKIRKELKEWESAFNLVHRRKPTKDDIDKAPPDIKDKYKTYFNIKKAGRTESSKGCEERGEEEKQVPGMSGTQSGVWGVEFNKKPAKADQADESASGEKASSLDTLSSRLFVNSSIANPALSKYPKKKKNIMRDPESSPLPAAGTPSPTQPERQDKRLEPSSTDKQLAQSRITCRGDTSKAPLSNSPEGDFSLSGSIFKQAHKMTRNKSLSSASTSHSTKLNNDPVLGLKFSLPKKRSISSSVTIDVSKFEGFDDEVDGFHEESSFSSYKPSSPVTRAERGKISNPSDKTNDRSKKIGLDNRGNSTFDSVDPEKGKSNGHRAKTVEESTSGNKYGFDELKQGVVDCGSGSKGMETDDLLCESQTKTTSGLDVGDRVSSRDDLEERLGFGSSEKSRSGKRLCHPDEEHVHEMEGSRSGLSGRRTVTSQSRKDVRDASCQDIEKRQGGDVEDISSVPAKRLKVSDCYDNDGGGDGHVGYDKEDSGLDTVAVKPPKTSSTTSTAAVPARKTLAPAATRKRSAASMNENYVCLNMKKKGYRRKGGGMTAIQLKRKQWKAKMSARSQSYGSNKCFKCGQEGHWASKCQGKASSSSSLGTMGEGMSADVESSRSVEESTFPSLREAALMARGIKETVADAQTSQKASAVVEDPADITDIEADVIREFDDVTSAPPKSCLALDSCVEDIEAEMQSGLEAFGLSQFRVGQKVSIARILQGQSTLVVLATGGGKSLCYQLPSYLYGQHMKAITLVVSPLVSLMEDQVTGLPPNVKGRCLHSGMTTVQQNSVLAAIKDGDVHFLLVSPEAVVAGARASSSRSTSCLPPPDRMPPIAFVCVDEAHCLSEWSHNFRPSYLRVCKILRHRYGVQCFLGLTATATPSTCRDVCKHLAIADSSRATIMGDVIPDNLVLSVSRDEDKDEALINLLQGPRFQSCPSIIIYCGRRDQTTRVAALIRTSMQTSVDLNQRPVDNSQEGSDPKAKTKKKAASKKGPPPFDPRVWTADSYHAGLTPSKRRSVQKAFMTGRLRVVVATVAFGMGLDKSDVRAVIHYSMAKSFESYVQEIGRVGRDGLRADCHTLMGRDDQDLRELQKHTYANSVDRLSIKKLVHQVFPPCRCREIYTKVLGMMEDGALCQSYLVHVAATTENAQETEVKVSVCGGHERSLVIDDVMMSLDVKEEVVSTLLCYLELQYPDWLSYLGNVYTRCRLQCYGGPTQLRDLAKKCPPVAVAIARQKKDGKTFSDVNTIEFDVIELCDVMGWQSGKVKRELKDLQWASDATGWRKTGVLVELDKLGLHFRSRGDLDDDVTDSVVDFLYGRTVKQEKLEVSQLGQLAQALKSVSHKNYWMCSEEADMGRSDRLKKRLVQFFRTDTDEEERGGGGGGGEGGSEKEEEGARGSSCDLEAAGTEPSPQLIQALQSDIRAFLSLYSHEHHVTGRGVARIFHGIPSPRFPADTWGRVRRFWRCHLHDVDFKVVLREATRIIVSSR